MKPIRLVIVALFALSATAFAQILPPDAGETRTETHIRLFSPFSLEGLNPTLTIVGQVSGTCEFQSGVTQRPDAWNCRSVDGQAYDPCFQNPFDPADSVLACTPDPQGGVTRLQLTNALPTASAPRPLAERLPWLLELSNGLRCYRNPALTWQIGGLLALYACGDNAYLFDAPDRSNAIWRIFYLRFGQGTYLEPMGVQISWY